MKNIGVLVSGGGTNLQALLNAQEAGLIKSGRIVCVVSNKAGAYALDRAEKHGIPSRVISKKDYAARSDFDRAIAEHMKGFKVDLIVMAGFLAIVGQELINAFPNRIMNVHPALIPSFCGDGHYGLKVHRAALDYGVKVSGATVHFVDEVTDGGAIILQKAVAVEQDDTPETLQRRIMEEAEWKILPQAVELFCADRIAIDDRKTRIVQEDLQMGIVNIADELKNNAYPGRGIVVGRSTDGKNVVVAYFIMGRSENSRNRIFEANGADIKTRAFDESKMTDPSLIIYSPVRVVGDRLIVTNGDQTDTIYDFINAGKRFEDALSTREFEPDAPNFTPRISGIVNFHNGGFGYKMSILKSADGNPDSCERFYFDYSAPVCGEGHFIHTYQCDGNPIPSFCGEPKRVRIPDDIDEFSDGIWNSLNGDNKVSLFVRYVSLETGETKTRIINKLN